MAKEVYDWKKTAKKFLFIGAEILVAGLVSYFTDNNLFLAGVPMLEALRNWLKHRKKK